MFYKRIFNSYTIPGAYGSDVVVEVDDEYVELLLLELV